MIDRVRTPDASRQVEFIRKASAAGYKRLWLYTDRDLRNTIIRLAENYDTAQQHVFRAALSVGVKYLRPTDIEVSKIAWKAAGFRPNKRKTLTAKESA